MTNDSVWMLEAWVLAAYASSMVLLLGYTGGQLHLLWLSRGGARTGGQAPPDLPAVRPFVTVQLPVYNERHVIARLLDAVAGLRYPRERLEIQLLDDSDDETTAIAARRILDLSRCGVLASHVRRSDRRGFKAGALAHGLERARGELIAIFDADFVPPPDFLERTVGYFADPQTAAVQARWGHLNRGTSLITRIQAFFLALHFGFEQPRRSRAGLFLNFNGTCGIWRRAAILDAGGWQARTITEDIDLSYRAQMRGWRLRYLEEVEVPGELPEEMSGFRSQQYRWLKGGAQNARLHLRSLLTPGAPGHVRWHGVHHLLSGSVYLAILAALLLSTPLALLKNRAIAYDYVDFGLPFLAGTAGLFWVFHAAQRPRPRGVFGNLRFAGMMVLFLVFTMGLAVHNGLAVASGWLGRESPFVRTPKYGAQRWAVSSYAGRRLDRGILRDILMLGYLAVGVWVGWQRGEPALVPLQVLAAAGLVWVSALSLGHPLRAMCAGRRQAAGGGGSEANVSTEVIA